MEVEEMNENNIVYAESVLDDTQQECSESISENPDVCNSSNQDTKSNINENAERHSSAAWNTNATLTLLKLYEAKLEMLETPKKKTRIWIAISENLKDYNIEVTPDQVRWKVNALAKKYKQSIDTGHYEQFKYFKEMNNIYSQYNVECDYNLQNTDLLHKKKNARKQQLVTESTSSVKSIPESKAMIELRKLRLSNRIEADRSQSKINLEKQWLEYLRRQEEQSNIRDEMQEKHLRLRKEELELRKKELEMKESLEMRKIELREKEQEEVLQIEKEKCEILRNILTKKNFDYN